MNREGQLDQDHNQNLVPEKNHRNLDETKNWLNRTLKSNQTNSYKNLRFHGV